MNLSFNYYHNLDRIDFYLCNPDERELFPVYATNRNLTLRFNDLSELTFDVDSGIKNTNGDSIELQMFDYLECKRLVQVTGIGWFQISSVKEHDDGTKKTKSVIAESLQARFKDKGFISEERVYCFQNPSDPLDDKLDSLKEDAVPSVMGQWAKQLGIKQDLSQGTATPSEPYSDWTVTYINTNLIYGGDESICRTFKADTSYGYDWIVNDVEEAFEVVVLFDFMYKSIHVMTVEEVTNRANAILTFRNLMKSIDVSEDAENIVTVLNCNGTNCDITTVNPTGTNYICDFSYYMDEDGGRWMSLPLIEKLKAWKADCDAEEEPYTEFIEELQNAWHEKTECGTELQEMSLILQDLKNAQTKRSIVGSGTAGSICGIVTAESVSVGKKSIKNGTNYYNTQFTGSTKITAYQFSPIYDATTKKWVFSGKSKSGTADSIVAQNLSDENSTSESYWYFSDCTDGSSYCKLNSAVAVNSDAIESEYKCGGFDRYIAYTYPIVNSGTGVTTYTDSLQEWIDLREQLVVGLNEKNVALQAEIDSVAEELDAISSRLNILSYFSDTQSLLKELTCYWIEGDYENDHISVLEDTTVEDEIKLARDLLNYGRIELSKVSQPRFSFSVDAVDATKIYEFKDKMSELELGKIVTIEKDDGEWYYPALLEISFNLDNQENFSMRFANALTLDDWGFTQADLISDAASTSRQVSANWYDILSYSSNKDEISSLIRNPLDATLRASYANISGQEFSIDSNGILGRRKVSEESSEYEDEQVRMINNVLLFMDDNWATARTALGKIYYTNSNGIRESAYGLIAETIVGSLIMGEALKIINADSSVEITSKGIVIKNTSKDIVFKATPSGDLKVVGEIIANSGEIGGCLISEGVLSVPVANIAGQLTAEQIDATDLKVSSANIIGTLTADKIDATDLKVSSANIIGTLTASQINCAGVVNAASATVKSLAASQLSATYISADGVDFNTADIEGTLSAANIDCAGVVSAQKAAIKSLAAEQISVTTIEVSGSAVAKALKTYNVKIESASIHIDKNGAYDTYYGEGSCGSAKTRIYWGMSSGSVGGSFSGSWSFPSSTSTTSDASLKNTINDMDERYDIFFDSLRPVTYKYNDGTSGRLHTGYIANEVVSSLASAGLTTQDFAGYVLRTEIAEDGEETQIACLRYEEFISLNTWQIQILKQRVSELEALVTRLVENQ